MQAMPKMTELKKRKQDPQVGYQCLAKHCLKMTARKLHLENRSNNDCLWEEKCKCLEEKYGSRRIEADSSSSATLSVRRMKKENCQLDTPPAFKEACMRTALRRRLHQRQTLSQTATVLPELAATTCIEGVFLGGQLETNCFPWCRPCCIIIITIISVVSRVRA